MSGPGQVVIADLGCDTDPLVRVPDHHGRVSFRVGRLFRQGRVDDQAGSRGGSGAVGASGASGDDSVGLSHLGNGSDTESVAVVGRSVGYGSVDAAVERQYDDVAKTELSD